MASLWLAALCAALAPAAFAQSALEQARQLAAPPAAGGQLACPGPRKSYKKDSHIQTNLRLARGNDARKDDHPRIKAWLDEIERCGELEWLRQHSAPIPAEDIAFIGEAVKRMPWLDPQRIFYVASEHRDAALIGSIFGIHETKVGEVWNDVQTPDGPVSAFVMSGQAAFEQRRATLVHEAHHMGHRPPAELRQAVMAAFRGISELEAGPARTPEERFSLVLFGDGYQAVTMYLEEGYTEWLTQKTLSEMLGKDLPRSDIYPSAQAAAAEFIAQAGEQPLRAFSERGDTRPLLAHLGPDGRALFARLAVGLWNYQRFAGGLALENENHGLMLRLLREPAKAAEISRERDALAAAAKKR